MILLQVTRANYLAIAFSFSCLFMTSSGLAKDSLNDNVDIFSLSLEQLLKVQVYSTSFFDTSVKESPGNTSIFFASDIKRGPYRTISDILNFEVPGFSVAPRQSDDSVAVIRGFAVDANTNFAFLVDKQNINISSTLG
ncbi:MAG: TonB-dependent receptor plug domain-containing protein, partial [Psychromonas sp.]|nr:TonB-dependent receptor plug domain-containing protein [Psychromonas sp.]